MLTRLAVLAVVLFGSSQAQAQLLSDRGPPQFRLVHRHTLAVRINPFGLIYDGRLGARLRLYEHTSTALRENFVSLGISGTLSPVYGRVGAVFEVQPLTVLGFFAMYEAVAYFGSINLFQSFPGARSNFADSELRRLGSYAPTDPRRNYPAAGGTFTTGANLLLKFGPIVLRDTVKLVLPSFNLRAGDTVFYDQGLDLLMPNNRFALFNDVDLLFQSSFGLVVGARYSLSLPFYGPENYASNGPGTGENSVHKLGPFVAFRFFDTDGAAFNQPTVALIAQWHLKHPYRTGADTSAALPYLALAFNVVGDLIPLSPAPAKEAPKAQAEILKK